MNEVKPDPIIAGYIEEIERPGIPHVSTSHITLLRLYEQYGADRVSALIVAYFDAKRANSQP